MGGRKPLPTQVKQIKGTLQPCRTNYHEPIPEGLLVEPPDYMPEGAKAAWRYALECAPPHLLKRLDMSVLEIWACAADLYRKAQIGIGKTGLLIKAPNSASTVRLKGACAKPMTPIGQDENHCRQFIKGLRAHIATCHRGCQTIPNKASGVTQKVTHGMAMRLARSPDTESCPKNKTDKGNKANVTIPCSFANVSML